MKNKAPSTIQIVHVQVGSFSHPTDAEIKSVSDQFQKALDNAGGVVVTASGVNVSVFEISDEVTNVFCTTNAPEVVEPDSEEQVDESSDDSEAEANG